MNFRVKTLYFRIVRKNYGAAWDVFQLRSTTAKKPKRFLLILSLKFCLKIYFNKFNNNLLYFSSTFWKTKKKTESRTSIERVVTFLVNKCGAYCWLPLFFAICAISIGLLLSGKSNPIQWKLFCSENNGFYRIHFPLIKGNKIKLCLRFSGKVTAHKWPITGKKSILKNINKVPRNDSNNSALVYPELCIYSSNKVWTRK